jgi:hypothetical protein
MKDVELYAKVRHAVRIEGFGYVPLSQTGAELLFEVFSQRYERGVAILGPGSGQANNPSVAVALNVTEIGTFEDQTKCKAAIASAHVEKKTVVPGPPGPVANIEYQFVCVERGKGRGLRSEAENGSTLPRIARRCAP